MKRLWFLLLAASIGLNAAMLWQHFSRRAEPARTTWRDRAADRDDMRGRRRPGMERGPANGTPDENGVPPYRRMLERRLDRMTRRLNLRDAQVDRLRAIAMSHFAEMDSLRRLARDERGRIRDLLGASDIDAGAVRTASARLSDINARIAARITENMIEEAGVLDSGQRERYLEMMRFAGPGGRVHRDRPAPQPPPPDDDAP